ncbi:helix-turn-helix transcriptional regulator [Xanthomonas translucens pv. translucens]|uniref:helix-turn-helix domain-containing protein n=1 Tax=Xanthomonas campestris pv. translucens TaxID=343 RepID=UPI003F6EF600
MKTFQDLLASGILKVELAKQDFAIEMKNAMQRNSITNAELAEALGVSRPMVTKLLRGDANVTIETMVKVGAALGCNLLLKLVREGSSARVFEIAEASRARHAGTARHIATIQPDRQRGDSWDFAANEYDENQSLAA